MRRYLEKVLTDEREFAKFVTMCCTFCTLIMVTFFSESDLLDAIMLTLNAILVKLAFFTEDKK